MTQEQVERPPGNHQLRRILPSQRTPCRETAPRAGTSPQQAFRTFLHERLREEITAAAARRAAAVGEQIERADRGLRLLRELVSDLEHGRKLDRTSVNLLMLAYRRHPQFRREWGTATG